MMNFGFTLTHQDKKTRARTGVIHTPHGDIQTPAFVPVGTQATVKSLTPEEIKTVGTELFFVNTYHMYLRPGMEVINAFGGLHQFMGWQGPIITDSGGFQVFSLSRVLASDSGDKHIKRYQDDEAPSLVKITEDGVEFRSHWDGSKHMFTPESSMQWQWEMGSDIHIAFDDCTPYPVTHDGAKKSMERTLRWAVRSKTKNEKLRMTNVELGKPYQALYGVVQGSVFEDLRTESARFIVGMDFDGIAIGGVSVGESKNEMLHVLQWVTPMVPSDKPRHLLGVGEIDDIFALVEQGIDTFDCVQPTRMARMGRVFTNHNRTNSGTNTHEIDINKVVFATDTQSIDSDCTCYTCQHFSRGYLHHLFRVRELLAYRLATIHNLHFLHALMVSIRTSIGEGRFLALKRKWLYDDV